ncbi:MULTISPECIES: phage tail protein [Citrobacter]|uniref:phage tail protein n=1 Tax=Citrobacter TaxID=544 RepID=UPI001C63683E|nr:MULTISPECIES: phage tail protein [Citrobacter]MDM3001274.1 phage tail protein [Citrobacter sp. CK192]MDM3023177.1 phage tail protein [Citrobacter sp. CK193]QYG85218.1 phage tail protein [Citrobacter koseri]
MSQTAITLAFEQWKAQQAETGEPVLLDEFVFALVPGLDPDLPVDRSETLPPAAQIVHREPVTRKGVVNENAVVHSAVLGADVGDFSFNWIGLTNKATGTLAMIVHAPEQQKLKTKEGQQGNVLTRSFLMEFTGAQTETTINTPAETWQIDFTARMAGMDERQRLENIDLYGAAAFFGDGWLVGKTGNQFFVTKGAGYVAGLRAVLAANQNITVTTKPVKIWLDVCWTGALTSVWAVQGKVTVAANLSDYEQNGVKHYVFALASIDANGNITDLRPKGTLGEQQANSDFVRKDKNLSDINDKVKSLSNIGGVPKTTKINGYSLSGDIDLSFDDVSAMPVEIVGVINDNKTIASANKTGWWRVAVSNTATISDFPVFPNGTRLYGYGYLFVDLSSGSWIQHYYSHRGQNAKRQGWDGPLPTADTSWIIEYNTANKPTSADVGALPISGGQLTGGLGLHRGILFFPESAYKNKAEGLTGTYATDTLDYRWELYARSKANSSIRSNIFTVDILDISKGSTASGGGSNNTTTITVHGRIVTPFQIQPGDWTNFDARYQAKGNYTPAGEAYTKAESDGRYYTKSQSDARYLQGIRVSATQVREFRDGGGYSSNDAAFATAIAMVGGSSNVGSLLVRYLQRNINGTWVNVAT